MSLPPQNRPFKHCLHAFIILAATVLSLAATAQGNNPEVTLDCPKVACGERSNFRCNVLFPSEDEYVLSWSISPHITHTRLKRYQSPGNETLTLSFPTNTPAQQMVTCVATNPSISIGFVRSCNFRSYGCIGAPLQGEIDTIFPHPLGNYATIGHRHPEGGSGKGNDYLLSYDRAGQLIPNGPVGCCEGYAYSNTDNAMRTVDAKTPIISIGDEQYIYIALHTIGKDDYSLMRYNLQDNGQLHFAQQITLPASVGQPVSIASAQCGNNSLQQCIEAVNTNGEAWEIPLNGSLPVQLPHPYQVVSDSQATYNQLWSDNSALYFSLDIEDSGSASGLDSLTHEQSRFGLQKLSSKSLQYVLDANFNQQNIFNGNVLSSGLSSQQLYLMVNTTAGLEAIAVDKKSGKYSALEGWHYRLSSGEIASVVTDSATVNLFVQQGDHIIWTIYDNNGLASKPRNLKLPNSLTTLNGISLHPDTGKVIAYGSTGAATPIQEIIYSPAKPVETISSQSLPTRSVSYITPTPSFTLSMSTTSAVTPDLSPTPTIVPDPDDNNLAVPLGVSLGVVVPVVAGGVVGAAVIGACLYRKWKMSGASAMEPAGEPQL